MTPVRYRMRVEWFPGNYMEARYACIIRRGKGAAAMVVRGYGSCPENAVQFAVAKLRRIRHEGGL